MEWWQVTISLIAFATLATVFGLTLWDSCKEKDDK